MTRSTALAVLGFAAVLVVAGSAPAQAAGKPTVAPPAIELEPKALNIIKGATDRLAAARTVSFKSVVSEESPSRLGPPLLYSSRYDVVMQRPDKLRILSPGDGPPSDVYYDGKSMAAFASKENYIARADAPPTIDAALNEAFTKAQIYYPFMDLLDADPFKNVMNGPPPRRSCRSCRSRRRRRRSPFSSGCGFEVFETRVPAMAAWMVYIAALTMIVGNLLALPQTNLKRLLA